MRLYYDLHMHSCLSPCGDTDMTPNNIVNMSLLKELDVIALSDHNTARNITAVRQAANGTPLLVVPAIEVCTSEEVHMLCLFEDFDACCAFGEYVYDAMPPVLNQPDIFGEQVIMNAMDEPDGTLDKLLINAADISIDRLLALLPDYCGFAVPAHVDKSANSIISNLGFIPPDYGFPCIEVKNPPYECGFDGNVITNSDAHYLEHISEREHFIEAEEKSIACILHTLKTKQG